VYLQSSVRALILIASLCLCCIGSGAAAGAALKNAAVDTSSGVSVAAVDAGHVSNGVTGGAMEVAADPEGAVRAVRKSGEAWLL
jgi:poly-gamma-glutamate capsule biosynthesis protein CapA/YwtB (metallophosphatase superfamily)